MFVMVSQHVGKQSQKETDRVLLHELDREYEKTLLELEVLFLEMEQERVEVESYRDQVKSCLMKKVTSMKLETLSEEAIEELISNCLE